MKYLVGCVDAYSSAHSTSVRMFEKDVLMSKNECIESGTTLSDDKKIVMGKAVDIFKRAANGDDEAQIVLGEHIFLFDLEYLPTSMIENFVYNVAEVIRGLNFMTLEKN
jgi:hypothetical protein